MRVQAEPTGHTLVVDGISVRVWQAVTPTGAQVLLLVHRVIVEGDEAPELTHWLIPVKMPAEIKDGG